MFKRMIAISLAIGMVFVNIPAAFAESLITEPISLTANGVLGSIGENTLAIELLPDSDESPATQGNSRLDFAPTVVELVAPSDEVVKITFTANNDNLPEESDPEGENTNFKSVIIFTDNKAGDADPQATGDFPAGLVNTTNEAVAVPLHWTVFPRLTGEGANAQDGAASWVWLSDEDNGGTGTDAVDDRIQAFVSDKAGSGAAGPDHVPFDQGFASVLIGLTVQSAGLANFPYDAGLDPEAPNNTTSNRTVSNGEAFVAIAANFSQAAAGTYSTNKLSFDLVNNA